MQHISICQKCVSSVSNEGFKKDWTKDMWYNYFSQVALPALYAKCGGEMEKDVTAVENPATITNLWSNRTMEPDDPLHRRWFYNEVNACKHHFSHKTTQESQLSRKWGKQWPGACSRRNLSALQKTTDQTLWRQLLLTNGWEFSALATGSKHGGESSTLFIWIWKCNKHILPPK